MQPEPRGIRNNNPLNIRLSKRKKTYWRGMRFPQTDPEFVQFESLEMGIRAACLIIFNYQRQYQRRTIRQIISRWAPATENNTNVYIYHVCDWMRIYNPDHVITINEIPALVRAMARQECGCQLDAGRVHAGYEMALQTLAARAEARA